MDRLELDVLMIRISGLMNSGRHGEARRLLETVLEAEPTHGVAHGMMGWLMWALVEDHERALTHFRCAVRWAPHHQPGWMHYLSLLAGDGRMEELREASDRALQVPGIDRAEVHAIVAGALERAGHGALALVLWRAARNNALTVEAEHRHRAHIRRLRARMRRARWAF
jgi:hypothetical protein